MMLEDSLAFSRDPDQLERRARQILNVACLIKDATAYDEALRRAQEMLDEAKRLRALANTKTSIMP